MPPSLLILGVGAAITYWRSTASLRESLVEKLETIATLKESALDTWVDQSVVDVVFLSKLPALIELAPDLVAESVPAPRRRAASEGLSELLRLALEKNPSFTEVFLLAPSGGRIVASTDTLHEGQSRIYDRYYDAGRQAPFVQNIYPSPSTLRPALTISAPVQDEVGRLLGVLAAHLSLDDLDRNVLRRTGLGRSGVVTLVDRHEVVVTGTRYGAAALGAAAPSVAIEEVSRGRSGSRLYRDPGGNEVIGVYRWLEDLELGLIVEQHQQETFSPARRQAFSVLLAGASFLALLVGGIYLAARRIARPILTIADAAARVREGDLDSRAPAATNDEIGALAETFNRMVEQLAADRTNRHTAEEVREALIAELESKNRELERFAYTVSHDLKSPLLTIKGFLGFLEKDLENGDAERVRADSRQIADAVETMTRLLHELLELSRAGQVVNPPEELPFGELAREVAEAVGLREGASGAKIVVARDLPLVFCDRVRLREVLENLVENAVKFSRAQSAPMVEIGSRRDGGETVLFVLDNGCGIEPGYQEKVFGLFDRLDPSIEGTGIGLSIVRRIIESHGGRIWVESEGKGKGSTFCFTLPERQVER